MKQLINEITRMQQLAGIISEYEVKKPGGYTKDEVMKILNKHLGDDYFEDEIGGEMEIESGSEDWMEIIADITGKNPYVEKFDKNDNKKINNFIKSLNNIGIELI